MPRAIQSKAKSKRRPATAWTGVLMENFCGRGSKCSFLIPTVVGGRRPFRLKFALKVTHRRSKNADFDRFPLSTVRDSEKSSIMTNRKSTNELQMGCIPYPSFPQRVAQKPFFCFLIKINFSGIKSATTKFLCVKTSSGKVVV